MTSTVLNDLPLLGLSGHRGVLGGRELLGVGLTLVRVPVAVCLIVAVGLHDSAYAALLLAVFVGVDVADGMAARSLRGDGATRTAVDSTIDRLTVTAALVVAGLDGGMLLLAGVVCGAASAICAPVAIRSIRARGEVLKAPGWHRVWTLLYAAAGFLWAAGATAAAAACAAAGAVTVTMCTGLLAREHTRLHRRAKW